MASFKWNGAELNTYGEIGAAMCSCQTPEEAAHFLREYSKALTKIEPEDREQVAQSNVGYLSSDLRKASMNKQAIFALTTFASGVALCAGIVALQNGALIEGSETLPTWTASVEPIESASPVPVVSAEPEVEAVAVESLPVEREWGAVRNPVQVRETECHRQGNVAICDNQERAALPEPEYKHSGALIGDYREDFLEALED
jgi:hypothetical protein